MCHYVKYLEQCLAQSKQIIFLPTLHREKKKYT